MLKNVKIFEIRPRLRGPIERQSFSTHCKGLQGITGALQGNWVTGIPHLQGFVMCHFTCNY